VRRLVLSAVLIAACSKAPPAPATAEGATLPGPDAPLPFDPDVRRGSLDNGLDWYIETNGVPNDRVVLRLFLDAGSVLEDEDQRGLAHVVEHMAFNGTEHFPGNSLITTLEGWGTRFGPHINAHTGFDETVYKLQVPSDDPEVVNTAFRVMADWAGGITFDPEEVEKERGVVLEEWRARLGAGQRVGEELLPLTFHGTPYPDRLPIGTKESLETFDREALVRFYEDWYRPELMSLVVVGDVDPDQMQALIETHFAGLENPKKARERVRHDIPEHGQTFVKVMTDPEFRAAAVNLVMPHDDPDIPTHGAYRDSLVESLASVAMNVRLGEVAQQAGTPYLQAGVGRQRLTPVESAVNVVVAAPEDKAIPALAAAWTEIERARRHGFTEAEVERARKMVLRNFDTYLAEAETTESVTHAEELVRHVRTNEPVPGIEYEVELARAWVPEITAEEVSAWFADFMDQEERVLSAMIPEKEGLEPPSEQALLQTLAAVEASEIAPPAAEEAVPDPVTRRPEAGTITATDDRWSESLGFTGWTLSNGVQVWFKRTDFKEEQVVFEAFAPGGHQAYTGDDYIALRLADDVQGASGAGDLSAVQLARWSAGRSMGVSPWIGLEHHGFRGSAAPKDLGDALSLLWRRVVDPRFTQEGLDEVKESWAVRLTNRKTQPQFRFSRKVAEEVWEDSPRKHPWTDEQVETALSDLDRLERLFEQRFGDGSAYTFVFVGNLPEDFEQSVTTWLGGLPAAETAPPTGSDTLSRKPGPWEIALEAATVPRAQVTLTWLSPFEDDNHVTRNRLSAVDSILGTRLREEIREERGGTYGVSVSHSEREWPEREATITVRFQCDPERVDELVTAVEAVVEELREGEVEQRYLDELYAKRTRAREERLRSNTFWRGVLAGALRDDEDPEEVLDYDARNRSLDADAFQEAVRRHLPQPTPPFKAVLLPAEGVTADGAPPEDEAPEPDLEDDAG
jgi:zinc protease